MKNKFKIGDEVWCFDQNTLSIHQLVVSTIEMSKNYIKYGLDDEDDFINFCKLDEKDVFETKEKAERGLRNAVQENVERRIDFLNGLSPNSKLEPIYREFKKELDFLGKQLKLEDK